ncbi:MAG: hypothetical protein WCV93_00465 [Candidatus Shapirobacteria bacterium]
MKNNTIKTHFTILKPKYKFTLPNTALFMTGVPLSGKSTIAPLISGSIESCVLQSMDVLRLVSQEIENLKVKEMRNPYVFLGSCDSYKLIGDGLYSKNNLIKGYNRYSEGVCSLLDSIIPKLEVQGAQNVLFEGVQLNPTIIAPYLKKNSKLIILTVNETKLNSNEKKLFGDNQTLRKRYSNDKLLAIQDEILRQSRLLPNGSYVIIDNNGKYSETAIKVMQFLLEANFIETTKDN